MSVRKEESGRRWIQVEAEVPGTPEEVWEAIATGPGISSWFCRTESDECVGGTFTCHMGPGMDATGKITAWNPPHSFTAEGKSWGPDAPTLATKWIVEARSGGMCIVRVVHSLFARSDDWDDELESVESGWPGFFRVLRLYLTHFRGRECSILRALGAAQGSEAEVWSTLKESLGIAASSPGDRCSPPPSGIPPFAGIVEHVGEGAQRQALLRLDAPAPGIAWASAFTMYDQAHAGLGLYLYGDRAAATVEREEPQWRAWMAERFPSPQREAAR